MKYHVIRWPFAIGAGLNNIVGGNGVGGFATQPVILGEYINKGEALSGGVSDFCTALATAFTGAYFLLWGVPDPITVGLSATTGRMIVRNMGTIFCTRFLVLKACCFKLIVRVFCNSATEAVVSLYFDFS